MTPTRATPHPSGQELHFFELDHVYRMPDQPDLDFVSATTWISRFFPEFEREAISQRYARKHNLSQEEVLARWDEKARIARDRGTLIHDRAEQCIENFINTGKHLELEDVLTPEQADGVSEDPAHTRALIESMHQAVSRMSEVLDFLHPEYVIGSPDLQLAGMIDLVVRLRTQDDRMVIGLYDWKTNAKIDVSNPWENALPPISHLNHCNFNHYSLQLNLYEYLCRREGYFPPDTVFQKVLIHLTPNGYQTHKCPDMQSLIEQMLATDPDRYPESVSG